MADENVQQMLAMLRAGNYLDVAAKAAGLTDEQTRDFREEIAKAAAEGEAANVTRVAQAARTSWQAAAWLLERSYPERWGRTSDRPGEVAPPATDSLDELAGRRAVRRGRFS